MEKLVVSCGGTGGHFFPGLSIARTFAGQGKKVILLLSGVHAEEQKEIAGSFGIEAVALPPMPHYRRHPLRFIAGFFRGYRMSVKVLKEFQPEAMLGMGSFAALPTVRAALKCKIPLFLHDGNARIGKANRFFSKKAKFTATAFPAVNAAACRSEVIETGMPLRPELPESAGITKADAINEVARDMQKVEKQTKETINQVETDITKVIKEKPAVPVSAKSKATFSSEDRILDPSASFGRGATYLPSSGINESKTIYTDELGRLHFFGKGNIIKE